MFKISKSFFIHTLTTRKILDLLLTMVVLCHLLFVYKSYGNTLPEYRVSVATDDQAEFADSARKAFQQLMVNLSQTITAAPQDVRPFIIQYRYTSAAQAVEVTFDQQAVAQWLKQQPEQSAAYPSLLLLITRQQPDRTHWITPDEHKDLFDSLQQHALAHGLNLIVPMMDLADLEDLNQTTLTASAAILKRYHVQGLLKADLTYDKAQEVWLSHWLLKTDDRRSFFDASADSAKNALIGGLSQAQSFLKSSGTNAHTFYLRQEPPPSSDQEMILFTKNIDKIPEIDQVVFDSVTENAFLYRISTHASVDEVIRLLIEHHIVTQAHKGPDNQIILG